MNMNEYRDVNQTLIRFQKRQIKEHQLHALERIVSSTLQQETKPSWCFTVIQNQELIDQLERMTGYQNVFSNAPTIVVAFAKVGADAAMIQTAMAMSDFAKAADEMGIHTRMVHSMKSVFNNPNHVQLRNRCNVPNGYLCIGSLAVGYIEEELSSDNENDWSDLFFHIR